MSAVYSHPLACRMLLQVWHVFPIPGTGTETCPAARDVPQVTVPNYGDGVVLL